MTTDVIIMLSNVNIICYRDIIICYHDTIIVFINIIHHCHKHVHNLYVVILFLDHTGFYRYHSDVLICIDNCSFMIFHENESMIYGVNYNYYDLSGQMAITL